MQSFEEMGLRPELLRTIEEEDLGRPTALQEAVIPALRRGGNLVARASAGSGKTLAYGLGILDRFEAPETELEEDAGLRLLVLTPTHEEAERVAHTLIPYAQSLGLSVTVPGASWGIPVAEAVLLVAAAGEVMNEVRSSSVKLEALEAVVIDGASTIAELGGWEQVDSLLDLVPRDAQRVVVSSAFTTAVDDVIDRRVKRALRYPAEAAVPDHRETSSGEGSIGYVVVGEREKLELLAGQLRGRDPGTEPPIIFCRSDERAAEISERLMLRGFVVGEVDDVEADVAIASSGTTLDDLRDEVEGEPGQTISFDVPPDARTLRERHAGDGDSVVLVEPRELAHLREIARLAHFAARSTPMHADVSSASASLNAFRDRLRTAIREEDLSAQMLVLEPLFEEFTPAEIAAAAAALLRSRRPPAAEAPSATPIGTATAAPRPGTEKSAPAGPAPVTWARLFVGVGSRDDIKAGDLVGALAGEANIPGSRIGKIEIRDSFSIVEVQAEVADEVIRSVNGTTMKGRAVRVDYDRGGPVRRPPGRGGAPARRTTRRPPGG